MVFKIEFKYFMVEAILFIFNKDLFLPIQKLNLFFHKPSGQRFTIIPYFCYYLSFISFF